MSPVAFNAAPSIALLPWSQTVRQTPCLHAIAGYEGLDGVTRACVLSFSLRPDRLEEDLAEFTLELTEHARLRRVRIVHASTSEVYGDPLEHPQRETYWGHVNPVGPRAVYDEAKRYAEALTMAYHRAQGVDTKIVRVFNCYGPGLLPGDGRVVSNFLSQAMAGEAITVYGDGTQTRSFCYVDDEVRGVLALLASDWSGPMNIGNPDEHTVLELAKLVLEVTGSASPIVFADLPDDEKGIFLADMGLTEPGLNRLIHATYDMHALLTFLTTGKDEVRACTGRNVSTAQQPARGAICGNVQSTPHQFRLKLPRLHHQQLRRQLVGVRRAVAVTPAQPQPPRLAGMVARVPQHLEGSGQPRRRCFLAWRAVQPVRLHRAAKRPAHFA